ncbi:MAG: U32 family peptidase [Desulfobacterales bacterium]|nr:MAG: U32 family peptidase [Desulfobacterales bacterium]
MTHKHHLYPSIIAPAGNKDAFLAAVAAEADAIYCGLKHFSARMQATNFSLEEMLPLVQLAHDKKISVYVALNSLLKSDDIARTGKIVERLDRQVKPDGIIIQDLSLLNLVRQTGYSGEIHISTLANVSFSAALQFIQTKLNVDKVVLPRELNIDEIKTVAAACPQGIDLEVFIHGALCYGVSGRCYWSSYLGGKSGLRGRCVQPCRRVYTQTEQSKRFFSCLDLSLDVLVKVLRDIPQVKAWKIEGRKKGPHYVFYAVTAYRMLRDQGSDSKIKKSALQLLHRALGRPGTHYHFLPQRPQNPVGLDHQTASGFFVGNVKGTRKKPYLIPKEELLPGDVLRIGYQDEAWHGINRVGKHIPKGGRYFLKPLVKRGLDKGVPVFLTDRREKALTGMLSTLEEELARITGSKITPSLFNAKLSKKPKRRSTPVDLHVYRSFSKTKSMRKTGLWLTESATKDLPKALASRLWWWLPPVIWPEEEQQTDEWIKHVLKKGGRHFVLNAPWQMSFFHPSKGLTLWAGPFCNIANGLAVSVLASLGFKGAIVSPELGRKDYLMLPKRSPLPLGIVVSGRWPLCISRVLPQQLAMENPFISPKGEAAWIRKVASNYWVFPNWSLNLKAKQNALKGAGYSLFVHLIEPIPKAIKQKKRPGLWNWELELL